VVGFLLLLALSFHSVIEGLGIGANPNPWGGIIAVLAHKALAAYALGTRLMSGGLHDASARHKYYVQGAVFSLTTPVGIVIGMAISGDSESTAGGVCTALAAGTFLYVAIHEVISHEMEDKTEQPLKLAALALGFSLMSLLALWL